MLLAACSAAPTPVPTAEDTKTPAPSYTAAPLLATFTPLIVPTQTSSPSALPPSSTPPITLTQAATQVWTPHPTLTSDEVKLVIQEWLVTNGECKLPCWWGITPGQTTWAEAWKILSPVMTDLFIPNLDGRYPDLEGHYTFSFWVPPSFLPDESLRAFLVAKDEKVETIRTVVNITLQSFLETYGSPSEVRIWADINLLPNPSGAYILTMFYPEQGIFAFYHGDTDYGDIMNICPSRITTFGTIVFLWSPEREISFAQAAESGFVGQNIEYFSPLEEISEMTITDFYETFANPENAASCIEVDNPYYP